MRNHCHLDEYWGQTQTDPQPISRWLQQQDSLPTRSHISSCTQTVSLSHTIHSSNPRSPSSSRHTKQYRQLLQQHSELQTSWAELYPTQVDWYKNWQLPVMRRRWLGRVLLPATCNDPRTRNSSGHSQSMCGSLMTYFLRWCLERSNGTETRLVHTLHQFVRTL